MTSFFIYLISSVVDSFGSLYSEQIEYLVKNYGIREIHFEDDNISLNRKRFGLICDEIIRRNLDITWTTPGGVAIHTLNQETLQKMKKSGCYKILIAIESGNQKIIDELIDKPLKLTHARKMIQWCRNLGITVEGFFIIGLPGENLGTFEDTIEFAKRSGLHGAHFFIATPYPGTRLYDIAISEKYIPKWNLKKLRHTQDAVISTNEFSCSDTVEYKRKAYREVGRHTLIRDYNLFYFFKRVFRLRNKIDFRNFIFFFKYRFNVFSIRGMIRLI